MFDYFIPEDNSSLDIYTPEYLNNGPTGGVSIEATDGITPSSTIKNVMGGGASDILPDIEMLPANESDFLFPPPLAWPELSALEGIDAETLIPPALSIATEKLKEFLVSPELRSKMNLAFGYDWDSEVATALMQNLASGQAIPEIEVLPGTVLKGANGAFDEVNNAIYVSQEFLAWNMTNPEAIAKMLLEEMGHYIDSKVNLSDSPGDDGEIFAAAVLNLELTEPEVLALKAEDDWDTINLNGEEVAIEKSSPKTLWMWAYEYNGDFRNYDWTYKDFTSMSDSRPNDKLDGIDVNWGNQAPFRGMETDEFAVAMATYGYFDDSQTYKFKVSADDHFRIYAEPVDGSGSRYWITPSQWQQAYGGAEYEFKPPTDGQYYVWAWVVEEYGDAALDLSWTASVDGTAEKSSFSVGQISFQNPTGRFTEKKPIQLETVNTSHIERSEETWVVIHGWRNNSETERIKDLAKAIAHNDPDAQVITLDWGEAAQIGSGEYDIYPDRVNSSLGLAASWIEPVAEAAANKLRGLIESPGDNLNLVGHSLGSYVAWEIAKNLGGVENLIALDPAQGLDGGYETRNLYFSEHSDWAWAFSGSTLSSTARASTAEEFFEFYFPPYGVFGMGPGERHGAVVEAFADLLWQNDVDFSLNRMNSNNKPWHIDYDRGEEAGITFKKENDKWVVSNRNYNPRNFL